MLNVQNHRAPKWSARLRYWRAVERRMVRLRYGSLIPRLDPSTTYLSPARLMQLEAHLRAIERDRVTGAIIECGVAAGGSAALMGMWLGQHHSERPFYLFDTFAGLPAPTDKDPDYAVASQWTGRCRGTVDDVRRVLSQHGVNHSRIHFVEGLFQDTIPERAPAAVAFAHLDGDWYESTAHCLGHLWPRLSPGGRVQIDDYGCWQGCRNATDEFLGRHAGLRVHWIDSQGIWLQKPHTARAETQAA